MNQPSTIKSQTSMTQQQGGVPGQPAPEEYLTLNSKVYARLNQKHEHLVDKLFDLFDHIFKRGLQTKDMNLSKQESLLQELDREQIRQTPAILVENIQDIVFKIFDLSGETIKKLESREESLKGTYDEVQLRLEKEVKNQIKMEEKLKIKIECLSLRQESLQKIIAQQEQELEKQRQDIAKLKRDCEQKIKQKEQEILLHKKEKELAKTSMRKSSNNNQNFFFIRPITANNNQGIAAPTIEELPNDDNNNNQSSTTNVLNNLGGGGRDPATTTAQQQQQRLTLQSPHLNTNISYEQIETCKAVFQSNKHTSLNLKSEQFHELKNSIVKMTDVPKNQEQRKLMDQVFKVNKQKEQDGQKYQYEISRLIIQVQQKESDNQKLRNNMEELHNELRKIRGNMAEDEKKKWSQEANSDKNPNLLEYYKHKMEEKDKEIKTLKKSQKKFAILEKKLLVKEKAFEYERSDYHDKVIYLNDRVVKLSKLYNDASSQMKTQKFQGYSHYSVPSTSQQPQQQQQDSEID